MAGFKPVNDSKGQEIVFVLTSTGAIERAKKRSRSQSHVTSALREVGTTQQMSAVLKEMGIDFDYPKPGLPGSVSASIAHERYLVRTLGGFMHRSVPKALLAAAAASLCLFALAVTTSAQAPQVTGEGGKPQGGAGSR